MKHRAGVLRRWFDQLFPMGTGGPGVESVTRGRVRRVNVLANGDQSAVVRFGMEEAERVQLRPGTLIECRVLRQPRRAAPGEVVMLDPDDEPSSTASMRAAVIRPLTVEDRMSAELAAAQERITARLNRERAARSSELETEGEQGDARHRGTDAQ